MDDQTFERAMLERARLRHAPRLPPIAGGSDWPVLDISRFGQDDITFNPYTISLPGPGGTNTKGAWGTIVTACPFDVAGLLLEIQLQASTHFLLDIAIGAAGQEVIVFPNYRPANAANTSHAVTQQWIPLRVPKGTRIAYRYQTSGTEYFKVKTQLIADSFAGIQPPTRWEDWGTTLTNSQGTQLTPGGANTKGSWVTLKAAISFDVRWVLIETSSGSIDDTAFDIAYGAQTPIIENFYTTNESFGNRCLFPFYIPKGMSVQARVAQAGAGSNANISMHGGG